MFLENDEFKELRKFALNDVEWNALVAFREILKVFSSCVYVDYNDPLCLTGSFCLPTTALIWVYTDTLWCHPGIWRLRIWVEGNSTSQSWARTIYWTRTCKARDLPWTCGSCTCICFSDEYDPAFFVITCISAECLNLSEYSHSCQPLRKTRLVLWQRNARESSGGQGAILTWSKWTGGALTKWTTNNILLAWGISLWNTTDRGTLRQCLTCPQCSCMGPWHLGFAASTQATNAMFIGNRSRSVSQWPCTTWWYPKLILVAGLFVQSVLLFTNLWMLWALGQCRPLSNYFPTRHGYHTYPRECGPLRACFLLCKGDNDSSAKSYQARVDGSTSGFEILSEEGTWLGLYFGTEY